MSNDFIHDFAKNNPKITKNNKLFFAVIIANENYQDGTKVTNALNNGEMFAEYCTNCLGISPTNVRLKKDVTLRKFKREVNYIKQLSSIYLGEARFILYYTGYVITGEKTNNTYLMPVDGCRKDASTGIFFDELYMELEEINADQIVIVLETYFFESQRKEEMLTSTRVVSIKAEHNIIL